MEVLINMMLCFCNAATNVLGTTYMKLKKSYMYTKFSLFWTFDSILSSQRK